MKKILSRSERRRAIARVNGAKSKGPISAAGKARSSQNALKHGLLSAGMMLSTEHAEAFEALNRDLTRELNPTTAAQAILARSFAMCSLRLNRIWDLEAAAQHAEIAKLAGATGADGTLEAWRRLHTQDPTFTLLRRYEMTYTRELHRTLRHLTEVKKCVEPNEPVEDSTPRISETSGQNAPAARGPEREGPDSSGPGCCLPENSPPEIPPTSGGNPAFLAT
jgi:hypothetical protein